MALCACPQDADFFILPQEAKIGFTLIFRCVDSDLLGRLRRAHSFKAQSFEADSARQTARE